jgi:hypothetical protein
MILEDSSSEVPEKALNFLRLSSDGNSYATLKSEPSTWPSELSSAMSTGGVPVESVLNVFDALSAKPASAAITENSLRAVINQESEY